jgi:hypothetical protein
VERAFARKLDEREDVKFFVKLPGWFEVDTSVGKYNPDWAIIKHNGQTLYLVRETKGTIDFLKLRTSEGDKIRCGQPHFVARYSLCRRINWRRALPLLLTSAVIQLDHRGRSWQQAAAGACFPFFERVCCEIHTLKHFTTGSVDLSPFALVGLRCQ